MKTNPKREAALNLLAATGIWRSSYAPPLLRLLCSLGFDVPPPHLATFGSNVLLSGSVFATTWGTLMWLVLLSHEDHSFGFAVATAIAGGTVFGLLMAAYYSYGK